MLLKVTSSKPGGPSPSFSFSVNDSTENEFRDNDDGDRNHKHRRQVLQSQSSDRDAMEQVFSRPFRTRNKPYEIGGHYFRENNSQSSEGWKVDGRRHGLPILDKAAFAPNKKIRVPVPQYTLGDPTASRGQERDSWNQSDFNRFSSVDALSQLPNQGSFLPSMFSGKTFSDAQNESWNGFGWIPRVPNSGLGLQGLLRPPINPSLNMGIPLQRCRDFEERGFCLRGDMCPMEHGVNRIVVEDVQSLSQFNLPVSLPSSHQLGTPNRPGSTPSVTAPPSTWMSNNFQPEMADEVVGFNCPSAEHDSVGGADFYDPDQPLWNNDCPEASSPLLPFSNVDESDSQSTSLPIWRRTASSKIRSEVFSDQRADYIKEDRERSINAYKQSNDHVRNTRKPSQKAMRTLFVIGIPKKNNIREALLLHFQKFGEVIDIYVPSNSERAFVQFSRREEAEAALKAPDAVMGNRFIKLWWAYRDKIPDNGTRSGNNTLISLPNPPVTSQGKDKVQSVLPKVSTITSDPKGPPPLQKKLQNLELLKEELRKKQEMLDQKRNDFRLRLNQLEKQNSGHLSEEVVNQAVKRHKSDAAKATTSRPSDNATDAATPRAEQVADKLATSAMMVQESGCSSKRPIRPLAPLKTPFMVNKFKLDNRPTTFSIIPPLPSGLANVGSLKEHFSSYGDLSNVELEDLEEESRDHVNDQKSLKNSSACVTFTSRTCAEKAFKNGKCWQGHNLQFNWLTTNLLRSGENIACIIPPSRILSENIDEPDKDFLTEE